MFSIKRTKQHEKHEDHTVGFYFCGKQNKKDGSQTVNGGSPRMRYLTRFEKNLLMGWLESIGANNDIIVEEHK